MALSAAEHDRLCLEVLKAIGKTLSQMNLYSSAHPSVRAMLAETSGTLAQILAQAPEGTLAYGIDADKILANGRIVGTLAQVPGSIAAVFSRFKLNSVTIRAGVTADELSAFCSLAALRPEAAKGLVLADYLGSRNVANILLNEAVYARVEKAAEGLPPVESGLPASVAEFVEKAAAQPIEQSIETLVKMAVPDPSEQGAVLERVMARLREDVDRRIAEATTEIRREKNTLQNEQSRTQAVLGRMAEGVVVVDDRGQVLTMNPEAEAIFGTRLVEAAGKPLAERVGEQHMMTLAAEITTPSDRAISPEVAVTAQEDAARTLRASAALVQNEQGKPVGMVSAISDLAKHREIDKVEREFVAHVTHELRAPLTSIQAALEILYGSFGGKLADEERRMMDNALKNADRLADLIKHILDFSKIESGQMTVYVKPANAEKIALEAVESMRPWATKRGIDLHLEPWTELPPVHADPERTVQVLVNLLSNALKFTPKGGRITVRLNARRGDKGRQVEFSVQDTGPGIAKEDQKKVFEKFVQIAAGERHVGGTGLGLSIAKALIHLQEGQMWLESDLGSGATFLFTLPEYKPTAEDAAAPETPPPPQPWWKRLLGIK